MPDFSYSDALREAFASCDNSKVIIDTLELSHPALEEPLRLVRALEDMTFGLENGGGDFLFTAAGFTLGKPQSGQNGLQELPIGIPNVSREIGDFLETCLSEAAPVQVIYRIYLSDDLSEPQNGNGIRLFLYDAVANGSQVTGRATFAEIINRRWPLSKWVYSNTLFPALTR
jgi:hypothetical protein